MKTLTLKQHDIANYLESQYDYISKVGAIKNVKAIWGSTFNLYDTIKAYNSIEKFN